MISTRIFVALVLLCVSTGSALAQNSVAWLSYRDQYRSMLWFEKYGKPKHLIQNHWQVVAKNGAGAPNSVGPVKLSLVGKSIRLELPLDETGRTVFPLLKAAYDENAELQLNQQLDWVTVRALVSIVIRADGLYEVADLRAACAQVLDFQNWRDARVLQGKKCVGVRFVFGKNATPPQLRKADQTLSALPLMEGVAFWGDTQGRFQTASVWFASTSEQGQVLTRSPPLALAAWFE